jgi:hypothetical protein
LSQSSFNHMIHLTLFTSIRFLLCDFQGSGRCLWKGLYWCKNDFLTADWLEKLLAHPAAAEEWTGEEDQVIFRSFFSLSCSYFFFFFFCLSYEHEWKSKEVCECEFG